METENKFNTNRTSEITKVKYVPSIENTIDLASLLRGKLTYPTWSTESRYPLSVEIQGSEISISYKHKGNKRPKRNFPRYIKITPKLLWFFGFIYGEGSKSQGRSAYRRFTITNSDPKGLKLALDILEETKLLRRKDIPNRSIKIARSSLHNDVKLIEYWKKELQVSDEKFYMAPKYDENKKTEFGVCHIFISDVLLRRTIDELSIDILNRV